MIVLASGQTITPIRSGAIIASEEAVREVSAYADIYVQLTEDHSFDEKWTELCQQLDGITRKQPHNYREIELLHLDILLQKRIRDLKARIVKTDRSRRGLFNIVGDIASSLFGIPSANDLEHLKATDNKLATEVEGVIVHQKKIVAKVNILGRRQQQIVEKVNEVIQHQERQFVVFNSRALANNYIIRVMLRVIRVNTILDVISENLKQYEESLALVQAMRISCESRIVTEQLIPIGLVENILAMGPNQQKVDLATYYAYIQVRKITEFEGKVYCVLRAPMFTDDRQAQITVVTVPTCTTGKCLKLYQPESFVMSYTSEELYYPNECFGPTPRACRPGVKYDKRQLPCLHGLVNGDSNQQIQCPITVYKDPPPPQPISTVTLNRYIVSTEETLYHYRCPLKTPTTSTLLAGSYVIDVQPTCIFDAMSWMLQGLPVHDIQLNRTTHPPKPINLTWLKPEELPLKNHTTLLPVGVKQLTLPNYEALQVPPTSSITDDIDQIQSKIGRTHWLAWLLMALSLVIGLTTVVCYIKVKCFNKMRKPFITKIPERKVKYDNDRKTVSLQVDLPEDENAIESYEAIPRENHQD